MPVLVERKDFIVLVFQLIPDSSKHLKAPWAQLPNVLDQSEIPGISHAPASSKF